MHIRFLFNVGRKDRLHRRVRFDGRAQEARERTKSPIVATLLSMMSYNINIHYIMRPTPCKGYQTIDTHLSDPVTQLVGRT